MRGLKVTLLLDSQTREGSYLLSSSCDCRLAQGDVASVMISARGVGIEGSLNSVFSELCNVASTLEMTEKWSLETWAVCEAQVSSH